MNFKVKKRQKCHVEQRIQSKHVCVVIYTRLILRNILYKSKEGLFPDVLIFIETQGE